MENILMEKLEYCKKELLKRIDKSSKNIEDLSIIAEEWFLFEKKSREHDDYSLTFKYRKYNSIYKFQLIIYNELKNIKSFKYIQDDTEDILSEYGSFYCGNEILYYNDNLVSYSDEQFLQIILNHIIHYTGERFLVREYEETTESLILLSFYHLRLFEFKIKYSLSCRKTLYNEMIYKDIVKDLIIFKPKKSLKNFILKNKINSNFFYVEDKYIFGIKTHISEERLTFNTFNTSCKKMYSSKVDDMLETFNVFCLLKVKV